MTLKAYAGRVAKACVLKLLLVTAVWPVAGSGAADLPKDPILRIETGTHNGQIGPIATDRAGRWIVTSGADKTIRVWELSHGTLFRVIRPPLSDGPVRVASLAMSPDGEWIAASAFTAADENGFSVQIFRRATGQMVRRISGLSAAIEVMAWSTDGRFLAIGLTNTDGVRIYNAENATLRAKDTNYASAVKGLDFTADGRLAVVSQNGDLRVYRVNAAGMAQLVRRSIPEGKDGRNAKFSPDGSRVAVSSRDAVAILDAHTLELIGRSSVQGANGILDTLAWGRDGSLFAGGSGNSGAYAVIRQWKDGGLGNHQDIPVVHQNFVFGLVQLANGGIAFSGGDGSWGTIDGASKLGRVVRAAIGELPGSREGFRIASDGSTVQFDFEWDGKDPYRFDLIKRTLERGPSGTLARPMVEKDGLRIDYKEAPLKLNGTAILQNRTGFDVLAIEPNGKGFALLAPWILTYFDGKSGKLVWRNDDATGIPGSVNISPDGRLVVAAYGDGTIRWYRISDGQELLALFPHVDKKRWVLWTPSGYYDASPGADDLIGWHLNRGKDQAADFFPVSRFRDRFYRPDIISKILATLDEKEAIRLANAERGGRSDAAPVNVVNVLPPVVDIVSPADGASASSSTLTLRYRVRTPDDAPVTGVRVRVNGQAVALPGARNLVVTDGKDVRELVIPMPAGDSEVQLFAENRNGVSTPASLRVRRTGPAPAASNDIVLKPKLYVLAVGVSKYADPTFNLGLAAKDAQDFVETLKVQKGLLYADVQVRLLTDVSATRDNVVDGLDWLKTEVTSRDIGMVFLAGHGINDNNGKYYFVPHNGNPEKLLRTGVAQNDIRDTLNSLAGKAVFFVDTCHAGNAIGTARTRGIGTDVNAFVNELASAENGVVVFAAATGRQLSQEDPAWGNGAFTKAMVEGLKGKADFNKSGKITHKGLDYYVAERVKELTRGQQSPVSIAPAGITDFPIAIAR